MYVYIIKIYILSKLKKGKKNNLFCVTPISWEELSAYFYNFLTCGCDNAVEGERMCDELSGGSGSGLVVM